MDETRIATHSDPVWRDRANFILMARLDDVDEVRWEQLWARRLAANSFEICCIPFFAYDLALGDEVETGVDGEFEWVVQRVVKDAGQYTFRVWFGDVPRLSGDLHHHHETYHEVLNRLVELGCLSEWSSSNLLAVSVAADRSRAVADYLWELEQSKGIVYETGRSKDIE
jgi:hypothetical protein